MQETIKQDVDLRPVTMPLIPRPSVFNKQTLWGLLILAAIIWSLVQAGLFQKEIVNTGGWTLVARFLQASLHPDFSPEFLALTLHAAVITLAYAVCGTFLSLLFGFIGGILASEVWWQSVFPARGTGRLRGRSYWLTIRGILAVPRAIHEIIWGLFFVNIFGLDPLTAIMAIAIPYGAIVAKVFSEILDETPRQPLQALLNSGATPLKAFTYGLFPQAFPDLLSYAFYRLECSIRAAAILGLIGAGGLGFEILLSLQALHYDQLWTLFYALFILNGLTDYWSALLRRCFSSASRLDLKMKQAVLEALPGAPQTPVYHHKAVVRGSFILMGLLLPFSLWYIRPDFSRLWSPRTMQLLADILQDSFPPRFELSQISSLFSLSSQTLAISILAMLVAGVGGVLLAFPAANNFMLPGGILDTGGQSRLRRLGGWTILIVTRTILLVCRSIPAPIWALVLLFVLFPGILPGSIALGLYTLGILGRLMAEVVENLDDRPLRALKAQGASGPQIFLYGVLPRTLPRFTAYSLYRWEVSIRETVVVGLVGAGGLGRLLTEQLSGFNYRAVVTTLICFLILTFLVDLISASIRRTLR